MEDFKLDYYREYGTKKLRIIRMIKNKSLCMLLFWRIAKNIKFELLKKILTSIAYRIGNKYGNEIPISAEIGKGLQIIHPFNITINSNSIIGNNCTLLKGCTIGNQKRGKNKGAPIIGNNVYVGINSTIVGNVNIGNNVLIAPNTYVNFDVPDNSIVIGSPGIIHHNDFATKEYISNQI